MAATGFGPVISLPLPPLRPWATFLDVVGVLPLEGEDAKRWPLGVTFQPFNVTPLFLNDADCVPQDVQAAHEFTDAVTQPAFSIYDALTCTALSKTDEELRAEIEDRWPRLLSEALAREFLTGTASGGHSLQDDDTALAASATVLAAISLLEDTLDVLLNGQGMIHMSTRALAYGVNNGVVKLVGDNYMTPAGHLVVADAGYNGASSSTEEIYATGPVYYRVTERNDLSTTNSSVLDRTRNILTVYEEAYGLIVFDPAHVWSTTTTRA